MKKLILVFLLVASVAGAEPFLVCDPQANVTEYQLEWAGGATEYVNAEADGSLRYDVISLAEGDNSGNLYAGASWSVDGNGQPVYEWSGPTPFLLTRPSKPLSATNTRLVK